MSSIRLDTLSPFGRLAVALDTDFSELARLSGQIERLELDSDGNLEHAVKLLNEFAKRAEAITGGIQEFSKSLQDAQSRSESAAKIVAGRAREIQERKQQQSQIHVKLAAVKNDVKAVNDSLAGFRKQGEFTAEEKRRMENEIERVQEHLTRFIADTKLIKQEASQAKFKALERDAQSLLETLETSRRKVTKALESQR